MKSTENISPCPHGGQEPLVYARVIGTTWASSWPAIVVRHRGMTLLTVHMWADRHDLLRVLQFQLTPEEFDWFRMAFGWPPGMVPLAWLEEVGPMPVPESLWLPVSSDEADRLGRALLLKVHDARGSSGTAGPTGDTARVPNGDTSGASSDAPDDEGRFMVPRKVEMGVEHPQWCETRRHCTVRAITDMGAAGFHRDDPERFQGKDDTRLVYEVSAGAFHDTDGTIDRPGVSVRIVESDLVDSFVEGNLLPDEARALAALLMKQADHADSLGEHYA